MRGFGHGIALLSVVIISVLMLSQISQITAQGLTPQATLPEYYTSANWMSWAATAWSYFAPGVGVNSATGLHYGNLEFQCFTDWDLGSYILSIIYAYKLGLITLGGTCADSQTSTWQFDCRIQDIMTFLTNRPLIGDPSDGTPYDFYSATQSSPYAQCSGNNNAPTSGSDTGRLLGALGILESVTSAYNSEISSILARTHSAYNNFATTCCNGADYYSYLIGEGYAVTAFGYTGCCGSFAAIDSYSGATYAFPNGTSLPEINTLAEPLNLELLLYNNNQAPHQPNSKFLNFARAAYSVQYYNYTQTGNLAAWTEGDFPPHNFPLAYIYEWILVDLGSTWNRWQLTGPGYAQEGAPGGPPLGSPVLAFTKTAFSYLALYGENPYANAQVNAVSKLATSSGFGEATLQNGQSALSLWQQGHDDSLSFYSDKTQEQVLESAYYAIQNPPAAPQVGQISSVVSAGVGSAWFVLPDYTAGQGSMMHTSAVKCGGVKVALATDVYAGTYLFGALTVPQQNEILDTNSAYISQSSSSCGQPSAAAVNPSQPLVTIAGTAVSETVHYYESIEKSSPLYYNFATGCITRRDTGVGVSCNFASTPTSDVFVMEAFTDLAGRTVYIIYGLNWPGTLAGYEYLVNNVLKNPSGFPNSWYVYKWTDAMSGVSANSIPDPGDTYTQIASGP